MIYNLSKCSVVLSSGKFRLTSYLERSIWKPLLGRLGQVEKGFYGHFPSNNAVYLLIKMLSIKVISIVFTSFNDSKECSGR